ncbi:MAG TPA: threonine/serine dehydratase [Streptosporangiaceae bacterium]|nr:threonine/serine dehydratase [Streptosporangiaceae bacterium]
MTTQHSDLSPAGQAGLSDHSGSAELTRPDGSGGPAGHEPGLTFEQVQAAAARLAGVAHRTPLLTSATLDEQCGGPVMLKAENFQRAGAFKFRGAYNRLSMLSEQERAAGVVAFSSGNHGGAVALAAKLLGIPAVVVVPATGAPAKLAAIEGYGAEMVRYDPATERRAEVAAAIAAARSMTIVRPFDDYGVMAGQGTLGIELAEQARAGGAAGEDGQAGAGAGPVDQVLVPVGGGGLAAGVSTAIRALLPGASVIGVEPAGADDTRRSFRAGHRVTLPEPVTIADGLLAQQPGELTFAVNSRLLDDVVTVSEEAIIDTMRFCFTRMKIVIEPSGAVALSALRAGVVPAAGHRSVAVISGGNIDPVTFAAYLAR